MTLACNDVFGWGIPGHESFRLADIARSGEHEDYSPFITRGRAGYLDQIAILTAREGQAVVIDHGDYSRVEHIDLNAAEAHGYRHAVVRSGLSRALGETDYMTRVGELTRLPAALNAILSRRNATWSPRSHVFQFSTNDWQEARLDLETEEPVLAQRARYVFEERERASRFAAALVEGRIDELLRLVNASGEAMSMTGPYQISGYNRVPRGDRRIAALDALRDIVLRHAGPASAARLIGGGGAGPIYALVPAAVCGDATFAEGIAADWARATGLEARVVIERPARGAETIWRGPTPP
jgi:galactokinase